MTYLFGDCELDPGLHELRRDGRVVTVEPQVFDLLLYLVEHRDRLISKDELNQRIWNGRFVSDWAVSTSLKVARQAIGDSGKRQDYIRTVPRRGFRFVGDVAVGGQRDDDAKAAGQPADLRLFRHVFPMVAAVIVLIALAVATALWLDPRRPAFNPALTLPDRPSVAVLPFTNLSNDPGQEAFVDGMTDDVITDLSKISGLFVVARNSVFAYRGKAINVRQVAEELGVRYVLEGSVRRAGDQVRINAQLIDATTDGHLWADRYDGSLGDVFTLQDTVTTKIVAALAVELSPSEGRRLTARGTTNLAAYDAYLLGLRHLNAVDRWRPDEASRAHAAFENAIELDPEFGAAYAGLAATIWFQADFGHKSVFHGEDQKRQAVELAKKSLELVDNPLAHRFLARQHLELGYAAVAYKLGAEPLHDKAVAELRMAVALEPNNADSLADLAHYLVYAGRPAEAATLIRTAKRLNPNFPNWYHKPAGKAAYFLGQYEAAAADFRRWLENDIIPWESALWLAATEAQMGKSQAAKSTLQSALNTQYTTTTSIAYYFPFKTPDHFNRFLDGLRKAGLPDAE